MRDIFTLAPLTDPGVEHVVPAAIGGKLTSQRLVLKATNNLLGSRVEPALIDGCMLPLNALGMTSRRGKTAGYALKPRGDTPFQLGSGLTPELQHGSIVKRVLDGKRVVEITARSEAEAVILLDAAKKKFPSLDLSTARGGLKREFLAEALPISLSIGGHLQLRAIAKMAFEGCALSIGNGAICGSAFDQFRAWLTKAFTSDEADSATLCNHDYRAKIWEGLPALAEAPFQHRVFVSSGGESGGAWGLVELFGSLRFSVALCAADGVPEGNFGYLVDPISGREDRAPAFEAGHQVREILEHRLVPAEVERAFRALMGRIYEKQQADVIEEIAAVAMAKHMPGEGEIIQPEHIAALSKEVAEEFTRIHMRINTEIPLDIDELEARVTSERARRDRKGG